MKYACLIFIFLLESIFIDAVNAQACTPTISIAPSSTTICSGTSVTLTASPANEGSNPIYQWKVNGIKVGSNSSTYTSSSVNNSDVITCELTSNATCATTMNATSNAIKMAVDPSPVVTITGDTCVGAVLTFNSSSPPSSLTWTLNGTENISTQKEGINPNAVTVAGGNGEGTGANQLANPNRFFIDGAGNMYIPDMTNSRIQKWAPGATAGVTVAGGNGMGSSANQFNRPTSVALDSKDNLYVTDQANGRVQKWAPGATEGITFGPYFSTPTAIFIDADDNIHVSEQNGSVVTKFTPGSTTGTAAAGGNDYGSASNQLSTPTGIFVDADGNLYVCDTENNRVQKWAPGAPSGVTVAGGNGEGSGANQLKNPLGIFVDSEGNIYISDFNNGRVQKWAPGATSGITVAGGTGFGTGSDQLNRPAGIWVSAGGDLFVSDFYNNRVQKFSNSLSKTYTPTTSGTYTATVTTSAGCTDTSNAITIAASKTPQVHITVNSTAACAGVSVTFTATTENGGPSPLFQWKINNVNTGTNSTKATFSSALLKAGDVVTCEMTSNATFCLAAESATSNTITMRSSSPGVAAVTIVASDSIICSGVEVTFTAAPENGGASPMFQWKVNGGNRGAASANPVFTVKNLKNGDAVSCVLTSSENLCRDHLTAASNNISVRVISAPASSVSIVASDTVICKGALVTFSATSVNGGPNPVYEWKINGTNTGTNNPLYSSSSLKNGDLINVSMTTNTQCSVSSTSKNIKITVDDPPVISIRRDTLIFIGRSIRLNTIVTGNISSYRWSPLGTLENAIIASPLATPTETTTYQLLVTTPGGCSTSGEITISVITEIKIPNAFSPNNDGINDLWRIMGLTSYSGYTVEVFNRYGQIVFRTIDYRRPWNGTYNGYSLPVGTYYYIIKSKALGTKSGSVTILK